jgi:hypothetical protein
MALDFGFFGVFVLEGGIVGCFVMVVGRGMFIFVSR